MKKEYIELIDGRCVNQESNIDYEILNEIINSLNLNEEQKNETKEITINNVNALLQKTKDNKNILVNGRVQSGKTNSLISFISSINKREKFDIVIYFTGRLNDLNNQNNNRFYNSFSKQDEKFFTKTIKDFSGLSVNKESLKGRTAIFSVIKYSEKYSSLVNFIKKNNFKTLIVNDEGDDSTFTESFFEMQNYILEEEGNKAVTITASPFKNLTKYNNHYDDYFVLEHPSSYTGIDSFKYIEINSDRGMKHMIKESLLDWMSKIDLNDRNQFLINIEIEKYKHDYIEEIVEEIIDEEHLKGNIVAKKIYMNNSVCIMNGDKENSFSLKESNNSDIPKIIIGSMKLSRGITFKNLTGELLTVNSENVSPSALIQKARWCGYRDVSRVHIYLNPIALEAIEELILLEAIAIKHQFGENFENKMKIDNNFRRLK